MELDSIAVFVKVVQAGSFSKAAVLLGMPNTTVSAKVAQLEKRLGITLIQRTTRKLNVTPAGQAYFKKCLNALEEIRKAESELSTSEKNPSGILRITAANDTGHTIVPVLISRYLKKYPEMKVELIITNRVVDLVGEGVDIGVRAGELEDSSLRSKKLTSAMMVFMASPAYLKKHGTPTHLNQLNDHHLMRFTEFPETLSLDRSDQKRPDKIKIKGRILADDLETLKKFTILGEGITLLPAFLCEEELRTGKLVHILKTWLKTSGYFTLVHHAQKFISPKIRAFFDLIDEKQL